MTEPKGTPADFVYAGKREGTKGPVEIVYVLSPDGALGERSVYKAGPLKSRIVGGVYTGARFEDGSAYGLAAVRFKESYADRVAVAGWQAEEAEYERRRAAERHETKYKSELETTLLPLRRVYAALHKRGQHHAASAFMAMVNAEMYRPLKADEKEPE